MNGDKCLSVYLLFVPNIHVLANSRRGFTNGLCNLRIQHDEIIFSF